MITLLRRCGHSVSPLRAAASLAALFAPIALHATNSNGVGGGNFNEPSTWSGGVVPTGVFQVLAGDTVSTPSPFIYDSPSSNNTVRGRLLVLSGSSVTMGRLNNGLVVSNSTVHVAAGALSLGRIAAASGSANNVLRVSSGVLTLRDANVVTGAHTAVHVGVTGHLFAGGGINGPLTLDGGKIYFANSAKKTGSAFTWNGGTVVLSSGSAYNASEANSVFNPWKTNAGNILAFSNETTKRTVTFGTGSSNPALSANLGMMSFNIYSPTNHDSDRLDIAGTGSLTLGSGVNIRINGLSLPGAAADYLGRTYKLFDIASGNHSGLTPTVTPTRWIIGGTGYQVGWTNTLASNGSLTVASLTPIGVIDPITVSDFNLPAQNAQGWTVLTPASDSRLIYVDPVNGNDNTGTFYLPGASAVGSNPQAPVGPILAVKTLAKAKTLLREDQPDWLLLKAGGVWTGESLDIKRGRSASQRAVVCAYGVGPRPELRTGTSRGIANYQLVNVIIQGIRFWAHTRDTDGPHFVGYTGTTGFQFHNRPANQLNQVRDILVEDCVFRSYASNSVTGNIGVDSDYAPVTRLVIRRSIISGNYSITGHSQGLYLTAEGQPMQPMILLQENTFDHNGWRIQQITPNNNNRDHGQATMFNHNTYFSDTRGVIFEKNLFLRPSSIGNKWTSTYPGASAGLVLSNNLYVDGEIGVSLGGNMPYIAGLRFADVAVRDNVFTDIGRSRPTNRHLSWNVDVLDWDRGFVTDNLIIHQRHTGISNTFALRVDANVFSRDVFIGGNVMANLRGGTNTAGALVRFASGAKQQNITFEDNIVQSPTATPLAGFDPGGFSFTGTNQYHSAASANQRFVVNGSFANLATWQSATGDAGALGTAPSFPAPTRDVEAYIAHLGLGTTFQDFVDAVHGQSRANWNPALTAPAVNNWLRAGFGLPPVN